MPHLHVDSGGCRHYRGAYHHSDVRHRGTSPPMPAPSPLEANMFGAARWSRPVDGPAVVDPSLDPPVRGGRASHLRHGHRAGPRRLGRDDPRRQRRAGQRGHRPEARWRHRRERRLHDPQRHRRAVHAARVAAGLQGVRPDGHSRHARRHRPRQRQARGRRAHRVGDGDHGSGAAQDRQGRRQRRPAARRRRQPAAEPVPQLPGADEPRAGRDAAGAAERTDRHAGPRAHDQRQRHRAQHQHDAHRRRRQHQRLAAAPCRLHRARRDDRERQHLDQQLRCGVGHDRRRGDVGRRPSRAPTTCAGRRSTSATRTSSTPGRATSTRPSSMPAPASWAARSAARS